MYFIILNIKALSLNTAYPTGRNGRRVLSAAGKIYKETIGWAAKENNPNMLPGDLKIEYEFGFTDNRVRDVDNLIKLTQDALTGIWFEKDSQIIELTARKVRADRDYVKILLEKV